MSKITLLAIDLAKSVFQLCGVDDQGHVRLERRLSRAQLASTLVKLPSCTVVMEACGSAHYWARSIRDLGHTVRLLAPQHVKAFNRGQKNDRNDAQAIACAARQPGIPSVAVKSQEQQAILALHRLRERVVHECVARTNQLHGLAAEFGLVLPRNSPAKLPQLLQEKLDAGVFPGLLVRQLHAQLEHLQVLSKQLAQMTQELEQLARHSEPCQRLMQARGIGPIIATAFAAQIGDPQFFRNGRQFAASLGLVPRQHSSADRTRLLGITKRGDAYLRKLLVHGARAAMTVAPRHPDDPISRWVLQVRQRRGANRAAVALANKLARRLWACLRYAEPGATQGRCSLRPFPSKASRVVNRRRRRRELQAARRLSAPAARAHTHTPSRTAIECRRRRRARAHEHAHTLARTHTRTRARTLHPARRSHASPTPKKTPHPL